MRTPSESAVLFGRFSGLVGILSEHGDGDPQGATDETGLPAVIILNTGVIHRVGEGRLGTTLARRLAIAGYRVLRFDLSGVGDSERRQDNLPPTDAAMADLRDAVDWLQSARSVRRVVLIGICSGGNLSLLYAGTDARVSGMVIVDPSTPPTRRHFLNKFFKRKVWTRQLGVYPDVGLKKARDRRVEMRKLVADGIDPSAARKQQKLMALDATANTFEAVAREWFEKHSANWEASYSVKLLARSKPMSFRGWGTARSATSRRQSFCR